MKKLILILLSTMVFSQMAVAQTSTGSGFINVRRSLATIMLAGVGGAVLGLSTLSFYGEPQEHVSNIWTGLAIGVIGGSTYVISQHNKNSSMALDPLPKVHSQVAHRSVPLFQYEWEF